MAGGAESMSNVDENGSGSSSFFLRNDVSLWLAVLALIVSGCTKLLRLNSRELWLDETYSAYIAMLPIRRLLQATAHDVHPQLFYVLLWAWVRIAGDTEQRLRLFGVVLSICCTVAMLLWSRRVLGAGFGALAAALFAFSPMLFVYSLEVRMYALFLLVLILLLTVHWRLAIERSDSNRLAVGYGVLASLLFYTHYLAIFVLLGLFAHWAIKALSVPGLRRRLLAAGAVTAILSSPGIPIMLAEHAGRAQQDRLLDLSHRNPATLSFDPGGHTVSGGIGIASLAKNAGATAGAYPADSNPLSALVAVPIAVALAGAGFLWLVKGDPICQLCAVVSLGVALGVFALHLYATRYLLPLVPLLVIALARGVQYVWEIIHWRAAAVILGSSILAIYTAAFFRQAIVPHPRPWEDLETAVEQQYRPGDTVIFDVLYAEVPFDYYARQRGFHPQETGFPLSIYSWWDSQWFKGWGGPVILQSDLDRFTANLSASNSRTLWLVLSETNYYDPHQALLARLRRIGQVTELQLPQEPRAGTADESPRLIRVSLR